MEIMIKSAIVLFISWIVSLFGDIGTGVIETLRYMTPHHHYGTVIDMEGNSITHFSYRYNNSFGECGYSYEVSCIDGKVILKYTDDQYIEYETMETELDPIFLDSLMKLVEEYEIAAWDGFSENNPYVMDGDGFSLNVSFANGESISAYGSNAYPENYGMTAKGINELFDPFRESLLIEAGQK